MSVYMGNKHIVCHIVTECHGRIQLYCSAGVLNRSFCGTELVPVENAKPIVLPKWRQAARVPLSDVVASGLTTECTLYIASVLRECACYFPFRG